MTIHRPQKFDLVEMQRVLELIQKDHATQVASIVQRIQVSGGSAGAASGTMGPPGPAGPAGTNGIDGIANLDLIVTTMTEIEDIIMDESGNVVSDGLGLGMTDIHTDWDIVTDDLGVILTAE